MTRPRLTLLSLCILTGLSLAGCGGDHLDATPRSGAVQLNPGQTEGTKTATGSPCTYGRQCPIGQGCGDDGACHVDGECASDTDCAAGQLCYQSDASIPAGFCASTRPGADPYCRSDGAGACRSTCTTNAECGAGLGCQGGFCHWNDECATTADCSPNHACTARLDTDEYGYNECTAVEDPACVVQADGVCRYECVTDGDCLTGGGCQGGLCVASNECRTDADCGAGEQCYPEANFGGLCGASGR